MILSTMAILGGLLLLYAGGESLVRGSSSLALRLGMTPLVVGLTVVAFGTSAPELVVSLRAALQGSGDIAVGNAVGSNILNLAVVLGLTAVVAPIRVNPQVNRLEVPLMVGASLLLVFFLRDGYLSRWEGAALLSGLLLYIAFRLLWVGRRSSPALEDTFGETLSAVPGGLPLAALLMVGGIGLLMGGARLLVWGAVRVAQGLGISEAVIGLTVVALGTSLPELATSLLAAFRKQSAIAVGNIIGSNLFNILGILGTASLTRPLVARGVTPVDLWMMAGTAILAVPILRIGLRVSRIEGWLLLASYGGYLAWLAAAASPA